MTFAKIFRLCVLIVLVALLVLCIVGYVIGKTDVPALILSLIVLVPPIARIVYSVLREI